MIRSTPYDAVVLAGGASRRMGGTDKTAFPVAGRTLLDRVLEAVGDAAQVVVVGDPRAVETAVTWAREQPAGTGPLAALGAGLRRTTAPTVVVLAADMPFVTADVVRLLVDTLAATADIEGVVLVDDEDREQWLCSAWSRAALATIRTVAGGSLRAALGSLRFARVTTDAGNPPWLDCDTPDDLRRAEHLSARTEVEQR